MSLPKQNRLRSSRDFSRVHSKGQRTATKHLVIKALKVKVLKKAGKGVDDSLSAPLLYSELEKCLSPQFGISISRKVSKRAVVRNRIKRRLQAIIRQYLPAIDPCWQVAIVVRPSAVECSFDDFLRELDYLLKKLGIVT